MNIDVMVMHELSSEPLLVKFMVPGDNQIIDLSALNDQVNLKLNLKNTSKNQFIDLTLQTENLNIVKFPLQIKSIVLDNFYQKQKFKCQGRPIYNELFLDYAKLTQQFVDTSVTDCDMLHFTGQLIYSFKWPFWRNLLQDD